MTTLFKSPLPEFRRLPMPNRISVTEIAPGVEPELSAATAREQALSPRENLDLRLPALREMLESDDYHVALVPRGGEGNIRGIRMTTLSAGGPALLLPFSWKELVAQVVQNSSFPAATNIVQFEDICVDFTSMKVSRSAGPAIILTTQEFKTLRCFLLNPDRVFSRNELLNEAWGYDNYPSSRTVDNHVLRLRQKLERDPAKPVHFQTVHGAGYKFVP